jgi:hypothetical protein
MSISRRSLDLSTPSYSITITYPPNCKTCRDYGCTTSHNGHTIKFTKGMVENLIKLKISDEEWLLLLNKDEGVKKKIIPLLEATIKSKN